MKKKILCIILSVVMVMSIMINLNIITIHAIDEYDPRISFDANGGSGSMDTVFMNGNYPLPECTFTPPEGYRFKCWHRDGDIRELQPGDTVYVSDSSTVVSAVWEPIPAKVIFDPGTGTGSMNEAEIFGDYMLPLCDFIASDGQQFRCWFVDGQEKQPGDSIYVDDIITATALWEAIPTEAPTEAPTSPSDNNNTNQVQNTQPDTSGDNTDVDLVLVIAIILGVVLICAVCIIGGVVILLVIKKKNK